MASTGSNSLARLQLALIPGLGPITQQNLVSRFGSAAAVFEAGEALAQFAGPAVAMAVARGPDTASLARAVRWLDGDGRRLGRC
jgi:hypothetical protein